MIDQYPRQDIIARLRQLGVTDAESAALIAEEAAATPSAPARLARPLGHNRIPTPISARRSAFWSSSWTLFTCREVRGQDPPLLDEVLPLGEVRKAHERLASGHGCGTTVLRVAEE